MTQLPTPSRPGLVEDAKRHHRAGRLDEAKTAYIAALAAKPDDADVLHLLGLANQQQGRSLEAVELIARAISIEPNVADWHTNLGVALAAAGRFDEAITTYRKAIALSPNSALAHNNLGNALNDSGRSEEALACLRRAIALRPDYPEAHNGLGAAFHALARLSDAEASYRQALQLRPAYPEPHHNLGVALAALGRVDEAIVAHRQAIALRPDYANAHGALAMQLLLAGDLREGFDEYRWRWRASNFAAGAPDLGCPLWEGQSLAGRTVLVHCEQGYGDSLQFIRYVAPLSGVAERVLVHTDRALARLFRSIPDVEVLTELPGEGDRPDYRIPLLCLPRLFATTLETIPADVPYLVADRAKVRRWAARAAAPAGRLKVGLVWAGDSRRHNPSASAIDRRRSVALAQLAPLAGVAGVTFFSLQKGEPARQAGEPPARMELVDLTSDIVDFEDTAALIAHLDLVISVDTSVAHLAGALGKPVWLLNRFDSCWRWLLNRNDSPWYPTLRQFRQPSPGDWPNVIVAVRDALELLASARSRR